MLELMVDPTPPGGGASPTPQRTWLVHLDVAECCELLATESLGRLGVVVEGRPEIFPVNHVYDPATGRIAFPTNSGTKLHAALGWPWVAYEVDGHDPDDGAGWSVLVVGHAEPLADPATIDRLTTRRTTRWAVGPEALWLQIVPERVTGRRISMVPAS
jgi:nitroimidazol reductase NimA-like FMN-containing flavoprotein (pyridoxamine 5'-phosphate oxidase superfamily)